MKSDKKDKLRFSELLDSDKEPDNDEVVEDSSEIMMKNFIQMSRGTQDRTNNILDLQYQPRLEEVDISNFIPLKTIADIFEAFVTIDVIENDQIDDYCFNQGINRSISMITRKRGIILPKDFQFLIADSSYLDQVKEFFVQNRVFDIIPKNQVEYEVFADGEFCLCLSLAETAEFELFISDLELKNPFSEVENSSMGHGVFNTVLKNIEKYAAENRYLRVGLIALDHRLMEVFQRRGYVIEDTLEGELAKEVGENYPMVKWVSCKN